MIAYFADHRDMLMSAFFEHLWLVGETLLLSIVFASVLSYILLEHPKASQTVIQVFGAIFDSVAGAVCAVDPVFRSGQRDGDSGAGGVQSIFVDS